MLGAGSSPRTIYAISELNEILRALVEDSLPSLWVQGEVSNFSKPSSGHWYFTLKDEQAQIRCAMFRKSNYYIRPLPQNGDSVLVRAKASVYPGRGELQLIVEHLEAAGAGALLRAFEELKQRLAVEGLFDSARKRPIVQIPRRIGLITSGSGAALHDVLTTLARRWPLAEVLFYPVPVQGTEAAGAIVKALGRFSEAGDVDTLLLVRGGGSIEDLSAFNDEAVARAIRNCNIPVVTGVGHEVDITIADFAADLRGATPTAAAELATPDAIDMDGQLAGVLATIEDRIEQQILTAADRRNRSEARLRSLHPERRLNERAQRLDELESRLNRNVTNALSYSRRCLDILIQRVRVLHPQIKLRGGMQDLNRLNARMEMNWRSRYALRCAAVSRLETVLSSLNPRQVLIRGYAIVADDHGVIVRDTAAVAIDQGLRVQLAKGALGAKVARIDSAS